MKIDVRRRSRAAIALSLTLAVRCVPADAADLSTRYAFSIPKQPLAAALLTLSEQVHIQVMTASADLKELTSNAVSGEKTVAEALDILLENTGLKFSIVSNDAVAIEPIEPRDRKDDRAMGPQATPHIHLAQAATDPTTTQASSGLPGGEADPGANGAAVVRLDEVLVTGSRLPQASALGAQEVKVYTREDLARSGQATVMEFLNTLAVVSTVVTDAGFDTVNGTGAVRLRGLPVGSTLVLLDGRAVQGAGSGQAHGNPFDINAIPSAAVERIEIVPEAASAIYGSDAIGGVVNIILRKGFDGAEVNVASGAPDDGEYYDTTASFAWGRKYERGDISLIASYQDRGTLVSTDRELTANQDLRRYGGRDFRSSNCNPGNVRSTNGSNLPGLSASSAGIPHSSDGLLVPADFAATSGIQNKCSSGSYGTTLIPHARRASALGNASYQFGAVEAFLQGMYAQMDQETYSSPRGLSSVIVPASNPFNPFDVPVAVSYRFTSEGLSGVGLGNIYFSRVLGGLRGRLSERWNWELAAWQSEDHAKLQDTNNINVAALNAALANPDPAQSINLFSSGAPASPEVMARIMYDSPSELSSRLQTANGFVRGSLFELPAGAVGVVLGGEYNRMNQSLYAPTSGVVEANEFSRNSRSLFTEVRVPLLAAPSSAVEKLAVSLAGRYDDYSDFGERFTPQAGIEYRPSDSLLIRGSYAEAFKAPDLSTVYTSPIAFNGIDLPPDPLRGGEIYAAQLRAGGNLDIKPQTGNSRSIGIVWSSKMIPDLELRLTNFRVTQEDRISQPTMQDILAHPDLFPGRIVRAAPTAADIAAGYAGRIQQIDISFVNYGSLVVEGFDLDVDYKFATDIGTFMPSLSATQVYRYDASVSPSAPTQDRLDHASRDAFATRWKGMIALGYEQRAWSAHVAGRYVSDYLDYDLARELGNYWLFDASVKYDLGKSGLAPSALRGAYASASVVNLLDEEPQFTNNSGAGYDPRIADIRGRFISLAIGVRW